MFYDLTTIRAEWLPEQEGDVRRHGISKEGGIRRQSVRGVVQTAEGLPLHLDRLPDRIRAHASVCFLALILHRLMRRKLREAGRALSPERAMGLLGLLGRIQHHQVKLGERIHEGVTTLTDERSELLATLEAEKPALG